MGDYLDTRSTVAARLFRAKHKLKFPENRQLDPYSDCYCPHTAHFELTRGNLNRSHFKDQTKSVEVCGSTAASGRINEGRRATLPGAQA